MFVNQSINQSIPPASDQQVCICAHTRGIPGSSKTPPIHIAAIPITSSGTAGAMNPASVQPLSVSAACEKVVEMKQETGGGRNPASLIRRI